jgi:hypothetical protein
MFSHFASFAAGFVAGWGARSVFGSTREATVRLMTVAIGARERLRRTAAEQVEWWEDMVAEAQSRYASVTASRQEDEDEEVSNGNRVAATH